jgi:hypothetical protein
VFGPQIMLGAGGIAPRAARAPPLTLRRAAVRSAAGLSARRRRHDLKGPKEGSRRPAPSPLAVARGAHARIVASPRPPRSAPFEVVERVFTGHPQTKIRLTVNQYQFSNLYLILSH